MENVKNGTNNEQYSLNDDRRVKVLSPGTLVAKRFFRNRLAVTGLSVLIFMFIFSFVGGWISPYSQDQLFYTTAVQNKDIAGAKENKEYRYVAADPEKFPVLAQAETVLAIQEKRDSFEFKNNKYTLKNEGEGLYSVLIGTDTVGLAYKDLVYRDDLGANEKPSFEFYYNSLKAHVSGEKEFTADGKKYTIDDDGGLSENGTEIGYITRYIVNSIEPDVTFSRDFKEKLQEFLDNGNFVRNGENEKESFYYTENGEEKKYNVSYSAATEMWNIKQEVDTTVYDIYSSPSKEHWLGTDGKGMDMLSRLMYGGRVSLIIGFVVVIIETVLGVIFGGIAGYFGKWVDNLIMRIVDIFYCLPSTPIIIIIGAAMDQAQVPSNLRMMYLMLILGFLGWPGIARLVRGQILSLREQEFMTATEACGISVSRRIFKHLIPNVIPQLIVNCSMSLGSTILIEATLSFLGLGVRFPFASWGNIINDVNDTFVLTNYLFVWIPAGVCLLLTVLAFNLVGDGLRDAFDPKMKR